MHIDDRNGANEGGDTNEQETGRSARDLGTVGGGTIPSGGDIDKGSADEAPEPGSVASQQGDVSSGTVAQQGNFHDSTIHASPGAQDASDQPQQGTLGSRNPGQPATAIGDQDATFGHRDKDDTPADPMTGRLPSQINKKQSEETGVHQGKKD
jgi:hypothetical protein